MTPTRTPNPWPIHFQGWSLPRYILPFLWVLTCFPFLSDYIWIFLTAMDVQGSFCQIQWKSFHTWMYFLLCSWGRVSSTFSYSTILFNPSKSYFLNSWPPKFFPLEAVLCYWECMIYLTQNIQWVRPISNPKRQCCESAALNMPANLENSAVATGLGKVIFIPIPKKGNAKECSNYHTIALISHASKAKLKILQARL